MTVRIVTGLVLAPIAVCAAWFGPDSFAVVLLEIATILAAWEFFSMSRFKDQTTLVAIATVWTALAPMLARFAPEYLIPYACLTPMLALMIWLLRPERIASSFEEAAQFSLGCAYVGLLLAFVVRIATLPGWGGSALLILFAVVWMGDTMAYFGGKSMGRHKLYPQMSPKKTVEGSITGLAGSVGGALLVDALVGSPLSTSWLIAVGILGGVAEQTGDLLESMLKRSAGVKDSGSILPGHGGMLDRIDGLILAAPVVYYLLEAGAKN